MQLFRAEDQMAAARVLPLEPALAERRAFLAKQLPLLARCMADLREQVDHWEQVGNWALGPAATYRGKVQCRV
jgi:hypothetical protein